ncbi:Ribonuclease M5 [Caloramator mitchellensis]|uniref:Ribonuclease M5 n=1 Tax=Caloramator mitchellensis TaxID=908809 RepID=A0A0R3JZB9_CALMK|nr:ribonuclease M5 [Caloramator mitchellensis]KRQ86316.1 Ribonuclease M5 [Caloramator mitchellensis]
MIKEVIIVEGKGDLLAVKRAVDADCIVTSGFGINKKILDEIKGAYEKRGIIIFTDPDFSGEKIREKLSKIFPKAKHAFLPREFAMKDGDIGIENASVESIIEALSKVKTEVDVSRNEFTYDDLLKNKLTGFENSAQLRDILGKELGIGHCNAKTFLNRLNRYGITREEFQNALKKLR